MSDFLPRLVIYHEWADRFLAEIRALKPEQPVVGATTLTELEKLLPDAEILICRDMPREALSFAGRLRWIQLSSAGLEGLAPVRDEIGDLLVTNARGIHAELMADHALAAMVMLQWDFPGLLRAQAERRWDRAPRRALAGQTLCVVGPGAIGSEVGRRAMHFGMTVIGVRRGKGALPGFTEIFPVTRLDEALATADFVCITAPATAETRHMIGARQFSLMKDTAFLVNIARGALVDERALVTALQERKIAGAALDVFEKEPPDDDNPLWTMPNVIITPHVSGLLDTNAQRVAGIFADNLTRYLAGEPLNNVVDLREGY